LFHQICCVEQKTLIFCQPLLSLKCFDSIKLICPNRQNGDGRGYA
jgi:hypothetical protein